MWIFLIAALFGADPGLSDDEALSAAVEAAKSAALGQTEAALERAKADLTTSQRTRNRHFVTRDRETVAALTARLNALKRGTVQPPLPALRLNALQVGQVGELHGPGRDLPKFTVLKILDDTSVLLGSSYLVPVSAPTSGYAPGRKAGSVAAARTIDNAPYDTRPREKVEGPKIIIQVKDVRRVVDGDTVNLPGWVRVVGTRKLDNGETVLVVRRLAF